MPDVAKRDPGLVAVADSKQVFSDILAECAGIKTISTVEPALGKNDFPTLSNRFSQALATLRDSDDPTQAKLRAFAVIETAARELFGDLISSISATSPQFVKVWNFFDILSILSDDEDCDPALLFWLIEELLDSQTIAGCRKIFDYLESRREQITGKHFKQKNLVILRMCNELLRRLSRAEDTAFCGRVYIFLFQSFPLGDRSSVNLRGEFHVENITTYEEDVRHPESRMEVDTPSAEASDAQSNSKPTSRTTGADSKDNAQKPLDIDELYPIFWSLQESFSQPLKLFIPSHLTDFKKSLDATMKLFSSHPVEAASTIGGTKPSEDSRNGLKRKREDSEDALGETFNPKYLTSKELFKLEINDLSFRRNVLVQALIIVEFLLSLSKRGKELSSKVTATNKNVTYAEELSEEDTKWAETMKTTISDNIKNSQEGRSQEGRFFHRTVETVLSRDKNWVYWKMTNCPPIQRDPLRAGTFLEAKLAAQRMATAKRLRPNPMSAISLEFMRSDGDQQALSRMRDRERHERPDLDDFKYKISSDDFEIEQPTNDESKAAAIAGKSSKSWRALRIAARSKLAAFDKIDDPRKIEVVFEDLPDDLADPEPLANEEDLPENRGPIILCSLTGLDQSGLVEKMMESHPNVFASVVRHTTRDPRGGEEDGKHFHFVKAQEFNQLRDGDRLLEFTSKDGVDYGTASKAVDAVASTGKVPVIQLDPEAAQFAKDMDFAARYVLVLPNTASALHAYLDKKASQGDNTETISALKTTITEDRIEVERRKVDEEVYDFTVTVADYDQLDDAAKSLEGFIYQMSTSAAAGTQGKEENALADAEGEGRQDAGKGDDEVMQD